MRLDRNTTLSLIFFFAIIGLAVAGYQTYEHHVLGYAGCDISATFSCASVTGSQYGEFPPASGIATSAWGVAWWIAVIVLSGTLLVGKRLHARQEFALFTVIVGGVGFMLYLLTIEFYVLPQETGKLAICPFCTVQHVLILITLFLSYRLLDRPIRTYIQELRP